MTNHNYTNGIHIVSCLGSLVKVDRTGGLNRAKFYCDNKDLYKYCATYYINYCLSLVMLSGSISDAMKRLEAEKSLLEADEDHFEQDVMWCFETSKECQEYIDAMKCIDAVYVNVKSI